MLTDTGNKNRGSITQGLANQIANITHGIAHVTIDFEKHVEIIALHQRNHVEKEEELEATITRAQDEYKSQASRLADIAVERDNFKAELTTARRLLDDKTAETNRFKEKVKALELSQADLTADYEKRFATIEHRMELYIQGLQEANKRLVAASSTPVSVSFPK